MSDDGKKVSEDLFELWIERLTSLERSIGEQTEDLVEKLAARASELDAREVELQARKHFVDECATKLQNLAAQEDNLRSRQTELDRLNRDYLARNKTFAEKISALDEREAALIEREAAVAEKELTLDAELAKKQHEATQNILAQKRRTLDDLTEFLADEKRNHSAAMTEQFQSAIKDLQTTFKTLCTEELEDLAERERNLTRKERRLATREKFLSDRENNLGAEVDELCQNKLDELNARLNAKDAAYAQLLGRLNELQREHEIFKSLKESFGEKPFAVMFKELEDLRTENRRLNEKISALPPESLRDELRNAQNESDGLKVECDNLRRDNLNLRKRAAQTEELETKLTIADNQIQLKSFEIESLNATNESLRNQLKRLQTDEGRLLERNGRIAIIETELPDVKPPKTAALDSVPAKNEMLWLESIGRSCFEYGFKFPRRILYAFHTALKIADWSTITVLAGVSGTGKSALPQLYAKFGGLNFMPVPVQPNWDSQESMLGFFNSIDNKFDAQPLLRFLAQCSGNKDGFDKSLNLVLLDEMNLAHVEHYFAEFLSKLESRRNSNEEFVDIPLGAGIEPYRLKLTRNVLWAGTMNQDETTKSLSDKVLDRGLVITFPRPKNLFGRTKLGNINDFADKVEPLDYRIWDEQWLRKEISLSEPQAKFLNDYRENVFGKINDCLAAAGRALGHRVWQSVEFYTMNYPEVIAALETAEENDSDDFKRAVKIAVEDQIVQKVMPKLRGIETRNEDCLKKIRELLIEKDFNLDTDFENAVNLGYGQFMWNSAEYIDADDIIGAPTAEDMPDD